MCLYISVCGVYCTYIDIAGWKQCCGNHSSQVINYNYNYLASSSTDYHYSSASMQGINFHYNYLYAITITYNSYIKCTGVNRMY